MKIDDEDNELAKAFLEREPTPSWLAIARLIYEVRTEQRDLDAALCEDYAEHTTYVRKAMAAKECARRITEGPAMPKRGEGERA